MCLLVDPLTKCGFVLRIMTFLPGTIFRRATRPFHYVILIVSLQNYQTRTTLQSQKDDISLSSALFSHRLLPTRSCALIKCKQGSQET